MPLEQDDESKIFLAIKDKRYLPRLMFPQEIRDDLLP